MLLCDSKASIFIVWIDGNTVDEILEEEEQVWWEDKFIWGPANHKMPEAPGTRLSWRQNFRNNQNICNLRHKTCIQIDLHLNLSSDINDLFPYL